MDHLITHGTTESSYLSSDSMTSAVPKLLRTFPNDPLGDTLVKGDGLEVKTKSGQVYLDMTGGFTAHNTLGWGNKQIIEAISAQLNNIPHIDYKTFVDPNRDSLAEILLANASHKLDRLFLCGASGGEACEAAIHLSYQIHCELGNPSKQWFISRTQSYHGATTDCMALGERPNLDFYKPLFPAKRAKVTEHNKYRHMNPDETECQYGERCAEELESLILELGPENVAGFVGETIMGGLVGDVPPTQNYWKCIRQVCDKYNVHLILDEVWCGCGISGKNFCIDWDMVTPDFIFLGKTFASGYMPISGVVTSSHFENIIKSGSGRLENSTTYQGHSACVAAALECQKIINANGFLEDVNRRARRIRQELCQCLGDHEFFRNVRGRGMRNSLDYSCHNMNLFGIQVSNVMKSKHNVLINGKWHRFTFSNAMTISDQQISKFIDCFQDTFRDVASRWTQDYANSIQPKNFF